MLGRIKTWQWFVLSVVIGVVLPVIRAAFEPEPYGLEIPGYGYRVANQGLFESSLVPDEEGMTRLRNITIYPFSSRGVRGYLVSGDFCGRGPDREDGQSSDVWYRGCFLAEVPYRPRGFPEGAADASAECFRSLVRPTMLDYLRVVNGVKAVNYRFAWWDAWPRVTWLVGSVVAVALFGRWW
jgi:hypothetical protein